MTEKGQMKLVQLSTEEKLDAGKEAAKLAHRLAELRVEFAEVKKDFSERIETTLHKLMETLKMLEE